MQRPRGAGPQRGEPRTEREPAHGSVSGVRLARFGTLAMCGAKRIVTRKRLIILEVTQYIRTQSNIRLGYRILVGYASTFVGAESTCFLYTVRVSQLTITISYTLRYSFVVL